MKKELLRELNYRLSRLESQVFGIPKGHKIKLSAEGLRLFPELKQDEFFLLRWHRDDEKMIIVQRKGKKSREVYHYSLFDI